MEWELLINPIFGGIIGYGTNYLAIKMLFRPHNPIYIGKMKVPFTPGLIPKEKAALARQMGQITEEYLLTEESLVTTLTNTKAKEIFAGFVGELPSYIKQSDKSISEAAQGLLGEQATISQEQITSYLAQRLITMLRSKQVKGAVVPYISGQISESIRAYVEEGMRDHSIATHLIEFGQEALEGELGKDHLGKALEALEQKADLILQDNAKQIGKGIIGAIGQGEEAEEIKESLQHWVDENFNAMVSIFINVDKIYEGIIKYANEALEDDQRSQKFGKLLSAALKGLKEENPNYKTHVSQLIKDQINDENIGMIIKIIINELRENENNIKAQINQFIGNKWDESINTQEFSDQVQKILREVGRVIGQTPLADLRALVSSETQGKVGEKVFDYYVEIIKNNSHGVTKLMDISNLVETKIKEYSSKEAEKLILSVVKEQLRGITWIGALLGTIIGILSNFVR